MQDIFVNFEGLAAPIRVIGCEALLSDFSRYFPAWPYQVSATDDREPFVTLIGNDNKFRLAFVDRGPAIHTTAVNAACDLIAAISRQIPRENPAQLCLHAASAKIGEGLIVFPATRRAGKSTLMAVLASKGIPVFGDDILPVTTTAGLPLYGLAGGIAPRLRMPLPPETPEALLDYLHANPGPVNRQYRYVPSNEVVQHGDRSPISSFVHLDRVDSGPARLEPLSRGIMLKSLMKQNFARDGTAQHILSALYTLASNTSSWALIYSDLEQAADLLINQFAGSKPAEYISEAVVNPDGQPFDTSPDDPSKPLCRHPDAGMLELDGEAFVATRDMTRIMHANEGAKRLWALLDQPTSPNEAVEILCAAFPNESVDRISADTKDLFQQFKNCGLTIPAE